MLLRRRHLTSRALALASLTCLCAILFAGCHVSVVFDTFPPNAATATAHTAPTATTRAEPILKDPLTSNLFGWPTGPHCYFGQGGYVMTNDSAKSGYGSWICEAPYGPVSDGVASVTVETLTGLVISTFGIRFRFQGAKSGYAFVIDATGEWALLKEMNGKYSVLQDFTYSAVIRPDNYATNTLRVEFRGKRITCSINDVVVGVITESRPSLGAGDVALDVGRNVTVVYSNFVALP